MLSSWKSSLILLIFLFSKSITSMKIESNETNTTTNVDFILNTENCICDYGCTCYDSNCYCDNNCYACLKCFAGYYKHPTDLTKCVQCQSSNICYSCEDWVGCQLGSCAQGYYGQYSPDGNFCSECILPHCTDCISAISCERCYSGYELQDHECVPSFNPPSPSNGSSNGTSNGNVGRIIFSIFAFAGIISLI